MSKLHIFDAHVETANRWMAEVFDTLQLRADEHGLALRAVRAGLHAIRDRIPNEEVSDLGAQLPTILRGLYYEGWTGHREAKQLRDRAAMIERVEAELAPDLRLDPVDVLRAVIRMLVAHVSDGEIRHVVATLPRPIAALWRDLTGHALEAASAQGDKPRRTGYAR